MPAFPALLRRRRRAFSATRPTTHHRLPPELPFLQWLCGVGLLAVGVWLLADQGLLHFLLSFDRTGTTQAIAVLFVAGVAHAGLRAWVLSGETAALRRLVAAHAADGILPVSAGLAHPAGTAAQPGLAAEYFAAWMGHAARATEADRGKLAEILAERAQGSHETGWFVAGLLLKLGLLGTVIGFMILANSVADLESFDISQAQALLKRMTDGMGIALITTLVGLVTNAILSFQYLLVDRAADRLVSDAVLFAETRLTPQRGASRPHATQG